MLNSFVYYFFPVSELIASNQCLDLFIIDQLKSMLLFLSLLCFLKGCCLYVFYVFFVVFVRFVVLFLWLHFQVGFFYSLFHSTKDCRFGNVIRRGITRHPNNILSLRISPWLLSPFTTKYFLITRLAIAANAGLANKPNIGAISRNLPFCLRLFHLSPIYQTFHLTNCFLFILKSRRLVEVCYKFYDIMQ